MLHRLAVLIVFLTAALALASGRQQQPSSLPAEHPVSLALRYQRELSLAPDQVQKLRAMQRAGGSQFDVFRHQMETIGAKAEELERSGNRDEATARALQAQAEQMQAAMREVMTKLGEAALQSLTPEQREKLAKLAPSGEKHDDFLLGIIMEKREALDITPQQYTKLQFLQADFIRAFAPLREQMEMAQLEAKMKGPSEESRARMERIGRQVHELQMKISEQAASDVLMPEQRAKLEALLRGRG